MVLHALVARDRVCGGAKVEGTDRPRKVVAVHAELQGGACVHLRAPGPVERVCEVVGGGDGARAEAPAERGEGEDLLLDPCAVVDRDFDMRLPVQETNDDRDDENRHCDLEEHEEFMWAEELAYCIVHLPG